MNAVGTLIAIQLKTNLIDTLVDFCFRHFRARQQYLLLHVCKLGVMQVTRAIIDDDFTIDGVCILLITVFGELQTELYVS